MLGAHLTVIARAELKKPRMERVCLKLNDTGVLGELKWPNLTGGSAAAQRQTGIISSETHLSRVGRALLELSAAEEATARELRPLPSRHQKPPLHLSLLRLISSGLNQLLSQRR